MHKHFGLTFCFADEVSVEHRLEVVFMQKSDFLNKTQTDFIKRVHFKTKVHQIGLNWRHWVVENTNSTGFVECLLEPPSAIEGFFYNRKMFPECTHDSMGISFSGV